MESKPNAATSNAASSNTASSNTASSHAATPNAALPQDALAACLARLERCVERPVVPGELQGWISEARAACQAVDPALRRQVQQVHPDMYGTIAEEDTALVRQVQQMRQKDEELLAAFGRVARSADRLDELAGAADSDEKKLDSHVRQFVDDSLGLILELRKQESALTTWYMEAFSRDRGVVD